MTVFCFRHPGKKTVIITPFLVTSIGHLSASSTVPGSLPIQSKITSGSALFAVSNSELLIFIGVTLLVISGLVYFYSLKISGLKRRLGSVDDVSDHAVGKPVTTAKDESLQEKNNSIAGKENESFFFNLVQSAQDGISCYDTDGKIVFANSAYYSIIGVDKETYDSQDQSLFLHPDDADYQARMLKGLNTKGYYEGELRLKHSNGNYVNLSTKSVLLKDNEGRSSGSLTLSRDITSLKKYHEELIQAKVDAQASNKLKASFLANISHEIRTPLNSVVGFANLLLSEDLPKAVKEDYIDHINFNSEKLLQIIGDIIDLSRLESAQIEITYEEASISEIIQDVIEETRLSIKRNEKPIILTVRNLFEDSGDLIFTDRLWLKRVLSHLMDNAVKFTLEGSVELSYSQEEDNIVFKVKDTGIGINKENLSRIFEEFRQEISGHHRPFEGLGVGLTLAKEVLERMGGKIYVESEKGIGSEFRFTIPYRPAGSRKIRSSGQEQLSPSLDWSSKKCLIVDDNKDVLIYLNRILVDTGLNVLTARSGKDAISLVKDNPDIDVVLLDMQMPGMNGIEATREIRKIRNVVPIIAQTAFIFEDDKDIILEAGCDACLIKPIRKDHLLTVLSGFIKS